MRSVTAPGPLVASGRWTDVYDVGNGCVMKRYLDTAAAPIAAFEAEVIEHAAAHGVPVPDVVAIAGGDLILERIAGPTMLRDLTRQPWSMPAHARTLAGLHRIVHAVPPLPTLQRPFGPGDALLHLDLHPDNVILSPSGPVVIDWQGAIAGPAAADVAHTWLLLRTSVVPGPILQRAVGSMGQRLFANAFLGHFDREEAKSRLSAVAARRLQDSTLLEAEAARIRRLVSTRSRGSQPT